MKYSLLSNHQNLHFSKDPFPFAYVTDALSDELYQSLLESFPSDEDLIKQQVDEGNVRFHHHGQDLLKNQTNHNLLHFVKHHCSPDFLKEFLDLFKDSIEAYYPDDAAWIRKSLGNTGIQFQDNLKQLDVVLNCMACINSKPKEKVNSVRSAHLDLPDKLYTGLFYMRNPDDQSEGGNLELYSFRKNEFSDASRKRKSSDLLGKGEIPLDFLKKEVVIPYAKNVFVIFLNTPKSIHGVSTRSKSDFSRRFFCVTAKFNRDFFQLNKLQTSVAL